MPAVTTSADSLLQKPSLTTTTSADAILVGTGVVTIVAPGHGRANGEIVCLEDIVWNPVGGVQPDDLNGNCYIVRNAQTDTFEIEEVVEINSLDISSETDQPRGVALSEDGLTAYVVGDALSNNAQSVYQYTLSTAWDVSTGTYASKFAEVDKPGGGSGFRIQDIFWSPGGGTLFTLGTESVVSDQAYIMAYAASTPWDVSTLQNLPTGGGPVRTAPQSPNLGTNFSGGFGLSLDFNPDGLTAYVGFWVQGSKAGVWPFTLSSAWSVTSISTPEGTGFDILSDFEVNSGGRWSEDGTKFFFTGRTTVISGTRGILQYNASTAYDLTSLGSLAFAIYPADPPIGGMNKLHWAGDCRSFYVTDASAAAEKIHQFSFSSLVEDCSIDVSPSTTSTYNSGGTAAEQAQTITGLDHLEGECIEGLANGIPFDPCITVSGGSITLEATKAQLGLPYTHRFKSLKQPDGAPSGSGLGKQKRIGNFVAALLWAAEFEYGDDLLDTLFESSNPNSNVFTGERKLTMDSGWSSDERFVLQGSKSLPWFCLAAMPELWTNDLL